MEPNNATLPCYWTEDKIKQNRIIKKIKAANQIF